MSGRPTSVLLAMALVAPALVIAQDVEPDWELADEASAQSVDRRWETHLLLRGDRVTGLPGGRADLERVRARLQLAFRSEPESGWRYGLAARLMAGSDSNRDNLRNNDNEKSDGAELAEAWVGWRNGSFEWTLGKAPSALALTPLLWDGDLRPLGAALRVSQPSGDFNRWELVAGWSDPDHPLGGSVDLAGLQAGWHWREGAPVSASLRLGVLDFSGLDSLARAGLGRGNSLAAGRYLHNYRLLDLQGELRMRVAQRPLVAALDLVRNLEAPRERDGARFSLVLGALDEPGDWEVGLALQRFQRDAVVAAFTSDDWWFHTAARGWMPWIGYAFDRRWSLRLSGFRETRDGPGDVTERVLLDLSARW